MLTARVLEQRRGRRRHGVELHGRERQLVERRRGGLRARVGLAHPADRGAGGHERLLVDIAADGAHAGDGADRRDGGEPLADHGLDLRRHQIAAVRVGADRHEPLASSARRPLALAGAHVSLERRLVLERGGAAQLRALAAERGPRRLQRDLVEPARLRVDRAIDARELFLQHDVAAAPLVVEPLVVGLLERLEGAHQLAMRHHGVERNARLGFQIVVGSISIEVLLVDWIGTAVSVCHGRDFARPSSDLWHAVPAMKRVSHGAKLPADDKLVNW